MANGLHFDLRTGNGKTRVGWHPGCSIGSTLLDPNVVGGHIYGPIERGDAPIARSAQVVGGPFGEGTHGKQAEEKEGNVTQHGHVGSDLAQK